MRVGWDDAVADWPGFAPLSDTVDADACVVGLGASGLAAVEDFADRGLRVVGVDAGRVAAGAAGGNGGFLIAGPALFLHEAIGAWGEPAVELYRATLAERYRLQQRLGSDLVRPVGSIRLAGLPGDSSASSDDELADCQAQAAALRMHGIAVEDYDAALGRGIFLPDDAATNPALRALRMAEVLAPRARLHEHTRAVRIEPGRVSTERGQVRAGCIVVAVDGGLDRVVPALAGRVRTARLQMLSTEAVAPRLPCPVYGRWGYDYAQQLPDGRLFAGGGRDRFVDEEWTYDATPTTQVQRYIERVAAQMAGVNVRVQHRWAASVGFTADARPLCAAIDDGVVAVGGYNGTGNLVGPVAARAAVALVVDGTRPPSWCAS